MPKLASASEKKPKVLIEFRGDRAKFGSQAGHNDLNRALRDVEELMEKAVIDRDRLQVRAQLLGERADK